MILLFGGTFDPIHNGHLYIAEQAATLLNAEKVLFIPCHEPPHRPPPFFSTTDRVAMLKLAINTYPNFEYSDIEINRPGPSYMIDTVKILKKIYPYETLQLLLGADAYQYFDTWLHAKEILHFIKLCVIKRDSHTANDKNFLAIAPMKISASDIRNRIKEGRSIDGLVPEAVKNYIFAKFTH